MALSLKDNTLKINTIYDLIDLSLLSNDSELRGSSSNYINIILTNDLDFNDISDSDTKYAQYKSNWQGCIGTWYIKFDGQNHTVKNISFQGIDEPWSFFQNISGTNDNGNIKLDNINIQTTGDITGFANVIDANGGVFSNISITGRLETTGDKSVVSGVIRTSHYNFTVRHCSFSGFLIGKTIRGIAALSSTNSYVIDSFVIAENNKGLWGDSICCITSGKARNCFCRANLWGLNSTANSKEKPTTAQFSSYDSNYCYFVLSNIDDLQNLAFKNTNFFATNSKKCFYEKTTTTGEYLWGNESMDATKNQLQSEEWMRGQGFPICKEGGS